MSTLHLRIVTPEKIAFTEDVEMVTAFTKNGEIGILPNHINLVTKLSPGEITIKKGSGNVAYLATGEGILQVQNNIVSVLTDLAARAEEIDEKLVEEAKKRAQEALEEKALSAEEYGTVVSVIEKSLAQLKVKRRKHTKIS